MNTPQEQTRRLRAAVALFCLAATGIAQGQSQIYADEAQYTSAIADAQGLSKENFDGGALASRLCPEPLNAATTNDCFFSGELVPGVSLSSANGTGVNLVLPSSFLPTPSVGTTAVGSNALVLQFDPPVTTVRFKFNTGFFARGVVVGLSDSAGADVDSFVLPPGNGSFQTRFFGVTSPEPFSKMVFAGVANGLEQIDDLHFGDSNPQPPRLLKSFAPEVITAGTAARLSLTLRNVGQANAATLSADLVEALPAGLEFAAQPNVTTTCAGSATVAGSTLTLAAGATIPAGDSCSVDADVTAAAAGRHVLATPAGALQTSLGGSRAGSDVVLYSVAGSAASALPDEGFDGRLGPTLPDGWVSSVSGSTPDWSVTRQDRPASWTSPFAAFVPRPIDSLDMTLDSPAFIAGANQRVTIVHDFQLYPGHEGAVLEYSVDGGEFQDLLADGGFFSTGGYVAQVDFSFTALQERWVWNGDSHNARRSVAQLPQSVAGRSVVLRLRMATESLGEVMLPNPGWWIDSVTLDTDGTRRPAAASVGASPMAINASVTGRRSSFLTLHNAAGSDPLTYSVVLRDASGCAGPNAPAWITAATAPGPRGSVVNGGGTGYIRISTDPAPAGVAPGSYAATACLTTNDPLQPQIAVPLQIAVVAACSTAADSIFCDDFAQSSPQTITGALDVDVPTNFDGLSFNFLSGTAQPGLNAAVSDDVRVYFESGKEFALDFNNEGYRVEMARKFGGVSERPASSDEYVALQPGSVIGPDRRLSTTSNGAQRWSGGVDAYLGVAFYDEITGFINYGYLRIASPATGRGARLKEWGYNRTGDPVRIP